MQTPKPKLDRAEGMVGRLGNTEQGAGLQFAWALTFPYTTQHVSCLAREYRGGSHGTACQCKWEAQGSSYVYHLPFPAITKQSAFISARLNQTQVKSREREAKASQVSSFVLACREIERALFDLPQEPDNDSVN